jgi:hypothetical protein
MATVGDLFINMKVKKDALDSASQSLGKFVDKSKKQLGDLNQGFGALGRLLSTLGVPTSAISSAMDFVGILTKGIPSIIKGFTSMGAVAQTFKTILAGIGGPITLIVAAIGAIGVAAYSAFEDQAASAAEAFQKTLDGVKQRAEAATKAVAEMAQALAKSREGISSMGGKVTVQQAVLAAPAGQEEAAAKQAQRLVDQLEASNAILVAEKQRDELQKKYAAAAADLVRTQQAYNDARADGQDEYAAQVAQILEAKQKEVSALEEAANQSRLNAMATADQLALLEESFQLEDKIAAKKAEQEAIEERRLARVAAMDTFMAEELAIEDEIFRLLQGEEALQERLYQRRLEAAGVEQEMIDYLMEQRQEVERLTKVNEDRRKATEEIQRLEDERKRVQESISQATATARSKAIEDEEKRMKSTETLDTAIGEFKIPGLTESVDIQKRIADNTAAQTAELRKLNDQIAKAQQQQQAPY